MGWRSREAEREDYWIRLVYSPLTPGMNSKVNLFNINYPILRHILNFLTPLPFKIRCISDLQYRHARRSNSMRCFDCLHRSFYFRIYFESAAVINSCREFARDRVLSRP